MKAVTARWRGVVLAETDDAIVVEGNAYFPPDALRRDCFRPSDTETICPWKGTASYLTVVVDGEENPDACWVYRSPTREAARLRGYYAFWRGVEIEHATTDQRRASLAAAARAIRAADGTDERALADALTGALRGLDHDALVHALDPAFVHKTSFFNFANSTTACFRTDHEHVVQAVNPTFAWTFGIDAVGLELYALLLRLGMDPTAVAELRRTMASHGWAKVPELRVPGADGDRWFTLDAVITRHADIETLSGVQGQFVDVTQEVVATRRLQELRASLEEQVVSRTVELREALADLRAIIDNIADGIVVTDPEGRVRLTNGAFRALFGLEDVPEVLDGPVARVLARADGVGEELELAGGRIGKAVASSVVAVHRGEELALGSVAVVRDITLEKEVDRMKTDFIANVSHELRTPLTSVLGFAKIIARKIGPLVAPAEEDAVRVARDKRTVQRNLGIIVAEAERLTRLINDVLDIAKIEAGKLEFRSDLVDLGAVVERAVRATAGLFADTEVALVLEVPEEVPGVVGDPERLVQVVINFVSNAAKFTERGQVTVRLVGGSEVRVEVQDTGVGIDPRDLDRVFEKFSQVGDTLTGKPGGTGLGLALCQRIVSAHGGRIWATSEVGVGSVFAFALPAATVTGPRVGVTPSPVPARRLPEASRGRSILVVDDDPSIRELLAQQLEGAGYAVHAVSDGVEALAEVRRTPPDLIVLDAMMPRMDGFDAAVVLRSHARTRAVPIVMHTVLEEPARGLGVGVDRYLTKSSDSDRLLVEVEELLQRGSSRKRVLVVDDGDSAVRSVADVLGARGYTVSRLGSGVAAREAVEAFRPMVPEGRDIVGALEEEQVVVLVVSGR